MFCFGLLSCSLVNLPTSRIDSYFKTVYPKTELLTSTNTDGRHVLWFPHSHLSIQEGNAIERWFTSSAFFIQGDVECMLGVLHYVTNSQCLREIRKVWELSGNDLRVWLITWEAIIIYFIRIKATSGGNIVLDNHTDSRVTLVQHSRPKGQSVLLPWADTDLCPHRKWSSKYWLALLFRGKSWPILWPGLVSTAKLH